MQTIQVNYSQVAAEVQRLRSYISSDIINTANHEYRQMHSQLSQTDGEANASLQNVTELHRQKTIATANTLETLLRFIESCSSQIEVNEQQIARIFANLQIARRSDA